MENFDFRRIIGYYDVRYPALDSTTPHYEFNSYVECCKSLGVPVRLQSFIRYHNYLKEIGVK
jgi:hypothetical protein